MKTNKYSDDDLGFLDIVQNMAIFFFIVVVVVMGFVSVKKLEEAKINSNAEYSIIIEWPTDHDCDVDTYLMAPNKDYVFFSQKEKGLLNLDRDDRGDLNDTIQVNGKPLKFPYNKEVATIRGIIPGEYILNIHMFSRRQIQTPTEVTISITKLNPKATLVYARKVVLEHNGQEKNVCRFTLTPEGNFTNVNTELPYIFIGNVTGNNVLPENYSAEDYDADLESEDDE